MSESKSQCTLWWILLSTLAHHLIMPDVNENISKTSNTRLSKLKSTESPDTAGSNSVSCSSSLCGPLKKEERKEEKIRGKRGNGSSRFPRKLQGDLKKCTIAVPLLTHRGTEPTSLHPDRDRTTRQTLFCPYLSASRKMPFSGNSSAERRS